jgi:hypothetical protein
VEPTVKIYKKAYKEYFAAYKWYEEQSPGLGGRFQFAVERQISKVARNPLFYPIKRLGTRESSVEEFPYLIVYKIFPEKNLISIVAIFHTSRNPLKKYNR